MTLVLHKHVNSCIALEQDCVSNMPSRKIFGCTIIVKQIDKNDTLINKFFRQTMIIYLIIMIHMHFDCNDNVECMFICTYIVASVRLWKFKYGGS